MLPPRREGPGGARALRIGIPVANKPFELRRVGGKGRDLPTRLGQLERALDRHERTAAAVREALERDGHTTTPVPVDEHLFFGLQGGRLDIVFNTYFGPANRQDQAYVASVLDYVGIPFTGGGAACHFIGLSKPLSKRMFVERGLPTSRFFVADAPEAASAAFDESGLGFPLIVKASSEGEGRGLDERSVVGSRRELVEAVERVTAGYDQPALVEEFLPGREFTVGVIDGTSPRVLPVLEIVLGKEPIYSYGAKTGETVTEICPAELPAGETARLGQMALRAGRAVGCRDYWRVDFRASRTGAAHVLEVNTLPGLQPGYSDIVKMAGPVGLSYRDMVRAILKSARRRLRF